MLSVRALDKSFHAGTPDEHLAIAGLDLELKQGDFAVVVGGNGAGKSTLLGLLAGTLSADAGTMFIDGKDVTFEAGHRRARHVARVFQDPAMGTAASLSIAENLAVASLRGQRRSFARGLTPAMSKQFRERLASFGLGLENRMDTQAGLLSGGQRQALALLMAVLRQPRLLLLDEHTAALDPRTAQAVMRVTSEVLARTGVTTLMVTHNMQHALRYGNRLIVLRHGQIVADLTQQQKLGMTVESLIAVFGDQDTGMLHEGPQESSQIPAQERA